MPFAEMRNVRSSRMEKKDDEFSVGHVKSQVSRDQTCRVVE